MALSDHSETSKPTEVAPLGDNSATQIEHDAVTRLANFLNNTVFLSRKAGTTEQWAACFRLAGRIRAGYVIVRRFKIPTPPVPTPAELMAIRTCGWNNESDDHRWLKYVAMAFVKRQKYENPEYERPYGPCLGDVVADGVIIECGDTDPVRVECIYDEPFPLFVSLPYQPELKRRSLTAFVFSITPEGANQFFISPWKLKQLRWMKYCNEVLGPSMRGRA